MNITSAQYQHLHNGDGPVSKRQQENYYILAVINNIPTCVPKDKQSPLSAVLEWAEEDGNDHQAAEVMDKVNCHFLW